MKDTVLYMKKGRAAPMAVCSRPHGDSSKADYFAVVRQREISSALACGCEAPQFYVVEDETVEKKEIK